jgi:hypothetical protein
MKKEIPNPGVDAVSGVNEGDHPSIDSAMHNLPDENTGEDESNYPHIEEFVKGLAHPHELHHAMYHAAKRLTDEGPKDPDNDGDVHVTMNDYHKLKKGE